MTKTGIAPPLSLTMLLSLLALCAPLVRAAEPADRAQPPGAQSLAFNRDIRPLLSDRCFKCHGFDGKARQAGLRLDTWEGLSESHDGRVAVVPGRPDASSLVARILADDPARVMPPSDSGLSLSDAEKATLVRWVEQGAPFQPHWGFVAPGPVEPPDVEHARWPRTPIDRFILDTLEQRGLCPSADADRTTLIRRASLDLTGLPPTPSEIDAFLADTSERAWERLIDRLLASPRFGERMALMWLDAARYADTNGFHHDNIRTAWPYRDWVIRAFNDNLPYDRFVIEQLAGDLLPEATVDQRIASGFCRMHNINDEGGALDDEYRVEAVADRIETVSTTFMGLTFTCARCHDHKYDPITQDDYYSLFACFGSIDERGVYGADFEQARAYPARLQYRPPELAARIEAAGVELRQAEARLATAEPDIARELDGYENAYRQRRGVEWLDARLVAATSARGMTLTPQQDGSVLASGDVPDQDTWQFVIDTQASDVRLLRFEAIASATLQNASVGLAENGNAVVSAIRAEAVSLADPTRREPLEWAWAWADHEQPNGDHGVDNLLRADALGWALNGHNLAQTRTALLLAKRPVGFAGGTRVEVTVDYQSRYARHIVGRPRITLARGAGIEPADFPTVSGDWWLAGPFEGGDFDAAYERAFGPEAVSRIDRDQRFDGKAWQHRPDIVDGVVAALAGEQSAFYLGRSIRTPVARSLELSLGSDDAIRVFHNGVEVLGNKALRGAAPDQDRVTVELRPGDNALVVKIVNAAGPAGFYHRASAVGEPVAALDPVALMPAGVRDAALGERFLAAFGNDHSPTYRRLAAEVAELRASAARLAEEEVPVLVMSELPMQKPTHVLTRGNYATPDLDRPVSPRPPQVLGGAFPQGEPHNRLGFAHWLTQPDHPLTARVAVNRLWQLLFGTGLVKTAEDFGRQADWPSHLDLLDWLAVHFVESGFDVKGLIRLIVTSSVYRQAAVTRDDAQAIDPENRLLAWFPRRRLAGELVRDQALYVSGLLVERLGGPSVKPYEPLGLWTEVSIGASSNTQVFRRDDGEALYRKSLYTFWKRTSPNPQMTTFDAPTRESCVVRRSVTNTPLQVLVLWNDVQFLEAARVLAQRTLAEAGEPSARLARMFRRVTGRHPGRVEMSVLQRTLEDFLRRYRAAPDDAAALIAQGEAPLPDGLDAPTLATWMMIASTLLCLDETIVRD